ncbi:LamG-like jellyroll fold domain-containing protein [Actinoplanes sp. NPDC051411]|uniref:LamG-like jellyroll fold domain-containing protein n=1 Tax=Actinoplanes sp. NPDC051411 TaxID=3155522 RepID=UPI00342642C5
MKIAIALALAAGIAGTATPALADTPAPAATITLVARYTFDAGATNGQVPDSSGHGPALTVRTVDNGVLRFPGAATGGRYAAFPVVCPVTTPCPRSLLEGASTADLNPGNRTFRWSARVLINKDQVKGSANIMQKGVAGTGSQWKMQIGATQGRAQCVIGGVGLTGGYLVRSATTVADGRWHKVLCQRSGTALSVYVDDVLKGTATVPATLSISNSLPIRIGGPNFKNGDMYHGLLDDVYAELG